jgi:hypothetical protein
MVNEPADNKPPEIDLEHLKREVERLNVENLLLRQRTEFEHLLTAHRETQSKELSQHRQDVETQIDKRLVRLTALGVIVVGLAWWSTLQPIRRLVTQRLDREFASANIRVLISDASQKAASAQTKGMMENILKPAVDAALHQIQQESDKVTQFSQQLQSTTQKDINQVRTDLDSERAQEKKEMDGLRQEYTAELSKLKVLTDYEEKVRDIQLLEGAAVQGDAGAFTKLVTYKSGDHTLDDAAQAAALESKGMYIIGSRGKGISIAFTYNDGTKVTDDKIATGILESTFLLNQTQHWEARDKAAELLADRREIGVVELLLRSMQADPNLWVRRAALRSFESQTNYQEHDVFDFDGAADWWTKNKQNYLKTITK